MSPSMSLEPGGQSRNEINAGDYSAYIGRGWGEAILAILYRWNRVLSMIRSNSLTETSRLVIDGEFSSNAFARVHRLFG